MIPKFLWRYGWARTAHGGKWERWGSEWRPVQEWATPKTHPELYGTSRPPEREDWA